MITERPHTGKTDCWRAKQNLVHQEEEKGAVTPKETDPDLPVSVQESPVEATRSGALNTTLWAKSF